MRLSTIVGARISVCTPSEVYIHIHLSTIGSALGSIGGPTVGEPHYEMNVSKSFTRLVSVKNDCNTVNNNSCLTTTFFVTCIVIGS